MGCVGLSGAVVGRFGTVSSGRRFQECDDLAVCVREWASAQLVDHPPHCASTVPDGDAGRDLEDRDLHLHTGGPVSCGGGLPKALQAQGECIDRGIPLVIDPAESTHPVGQVQAAEHRKFLLRLCHPSSEDGMRTLVYVGGRDVELFVERLEGLERFFAKLLECRDGLGLVGLRAGHRVDRHLLAQGGA